MTNKIHYKQKGGDTKPLQITNSSDTKEFVPIKRLPYDVKLFSFFCILGIIFKIIFARGTDDYATATVWGYGFSVLALLGLIVSSFAISSKNQFSEGIIGFFKITVASSLPIILSIVIITLTIMQNISFYDQINSGKVADEFYSFSTLSSFLILVQVALVINFVIDKLNGSTSGKNKSEIMNTIASEINSIILILSIANIGFIGILQVILKYFSTDG